MATLMHSPLPLTEMPPPLTNLHRPFFLDPDEAGWLIIDMDNAPYKHPKFCLLIEDWRTKYQIVVYSRLPHNLNVSRLLTLWECYVGPFAEHLLITCPTHMLSAHLLQAVQNQPDWINLMNSIKETEL